MILVHIHDEADQELARVYMRQAPSAGELLWFQGSAGHRLREALGHSSFTVIEVAHWVGEEWSPNTHVGDPIHSVCAYVKPTRASA